MNFQMQVALAVNSRIVNTFSILLVDKSNYSSAGIF